MKLINALKTHKVWLSFAMGAALLCGCNYSNGDTKTPEQIKAQLQKEIPIMTNIESISNGPVAGLYELVVGRKVFYVSNDGKYLVFGNIVDIASKKSLTEERDMELNKIDWNKLPLDSAIKEVNGNGKRKIAVFSDPDCPYCKMFEKQTVPNLKDTTVYVFLFPLTQIHPNSEMHSKQIWCSKDRVKTFKAWMTEDKALPSNTMCDVTGLDKGIAAARDLAQVEATPTLVLSNGQIVAGALPANLLRRARQTGHGL